MLVSISQQQSGQQGQLLGQEPAGSIHQLEFSLDQEERLTLRQSLGSMTREDWLWFASPNLRLRLSLMTQAGQLQQATWYSEIRRSTHPAEV
ncbi:MAG: phycobiliprotein lyase [Acaryochloridaceae cyanobacterium SU_2_1]|nr:phycobiliprotein lyase [Acaryochloridaceae cyanobacterium SU_2_1]